MPVTPETERVGARSDPRFNPAIASLRKALSSGKEAEDGFLKWRSEKFTRAFLDALAELADSPHPNLDVYLGSDQALVQYGMTAGLNLAYRLLTQPNRVFPEVFRGDAPGPVDYLLDQAYSDNDTPDSVIERM